MARVVATSPSQSSHALPIELSDHGASDHAGVATTQELLT
jgi:hypothetical protein